MSSKLNNIIVTAVTIDLTERIVKKVGYDYQAPLPQDKVDEIISAEVGKVLGKSTQGAN